MFDSPKFAVFNKKVSGPPVFRVEFHGGDRRLRGHEGPSVDEEVGGWTEVRRRRDTQRQKRRRLPVARRTQSRMGLPE